MQNIKWQAVIPAIILIAAIGIFIFKPDTSSVKTVSTFRPVNSDTPLSTKPKNQADNDEKMSFDPTIMPKTMLDKVVELYPNQNTTAINWVQQKYGWEALFELDGQDIEVEFDKSGNWIETELENVARTMIPQRVLAAVQSRFPSCQFKEYEIEYTIDGTFYEIEIMDGGQERELYFNDKGERKTNTNED
jgi:uncharacterized membrane protein YkoI